MYISLTFLAALAAVAPVYGNPAPRAEPAPNPTRHLLYATDVAKKPLGHEKRGKINECQVVNYVVDALKVFSRQAYPFCSSFISIQPVTSTFTTVSQLSSGVK